MKWIINYNLWEEFIMNFPHLSQFRKPDESKLTAKDADLMIKHLDRIQIGYSLLVAYGLEVGMDENVILDDIELMVKKCFTDGNISTINNSREISELIFMQLKKRNNY